MCPTLTSLLMLSVDFLNAVFVSRVMGALYVRNMSQHLVLMMEVVSLYDLKINLRIRFTWPTALAGKTFRILIYGYSLVILLEME